MIKQPLKVVIVVDSETGDIFRVFPLANVDLMLETDVIAVVDLVDNTLFEAFIVGDTILVDVAGNVEDKGFIVVTVVVLTFKLCVDAVSMLFLVTESN